MQRSERATKTVQAIALQSLRDFLSKRISDHFSEADSDKIAEEASNLIAANLSGSFDFNQILREQDALDSKGRVNAATVIAAVEQTADQMQSKPGAAPKLRHLSANMRHIFTELRLLKPGGTDGET